MSRPIIVVEPHADDAFLSLGSTIRSWTEFGLTVTIYTVFGNAARLAEARSFAHSIGASWTSAGLPESGVGLRGELSEEDLIVMRSALRLVRRELDRIGGWRVGPLGLRHPEHREVAGSIPADARYIDTPYQLVKRNAEELANRLSGRKETHRLSPPTSKWDAIPLFRSQSLFFYRNNPRRLAAADEVLTEVVG
jgi:hypothetical protein